MVVKRPNGNVLYQHLRLQDPPKFTQIGIFGLKMCHLANLSRKVVSSVLGTYLGQALPGCSLLTGFSAEVLGEKLTAFEVIIFLLSEAQL
jgi:hypothetical protein